MRGAGDVQRTESRNDSRAAGEWMRSGGAGGPGVLRSSRRTRGSARCSARSGAKKLRRVSFAGFRSNDHEFRRLRIDAKGIRTLVRGGFSRCGQNRRIHCKDARYHRIPRGVGSNCNVEAVADAGHVSGFVPFGSRAKNTRSAAATDSDDSSSRLLRDGAIGSMLRVGGRL